MKWLLCCGIARCTASPTDQCIPGSRDC